MLRKNNRLSVLIIAFIASLFTFGSAVADTYYSSSGGGGGYYGYGHCRHGSCEGRHFKREVCRWVPAHWRHGVWYPAHKECFIKYGRGYRY